MSQPTNDAAAIKAAVEQHYNRAIRAGPQGCCGPAAGAASAGCCATNSSELTLYGAEALALLPEGVVTTSFGCGNPLAIASLQPGDIVLDLGSGGGLDVLLAAQRVGATGYVYGLDMTDAMLEVARRNATTAGATSVAFLKGDIEAIPLPDAAVNVIISNCVINLAPDKGQVLSDAFRVLKPGGRLAVSDIVIDGDLNDLPISETQLRATLSWAGCIAGALTIAQYRALLAAAGFARISLEVTQRYSAADLRMLSPDAVAQLSDEVVAALADKITSCAITAWRP